MREHIGGIEYVRAHIEEALAVDGRVAEGALEVGVEGDELVITGSVPTEARRAAVATVAQEAAAGIPVRNETVVVSLDEPEPQHAERVE